MTEEERSRRAGAPAGGDAEANTPQTEIANPIDKLSDAELLRAIYGDVLDPTVRENFRYRLRLQAAQLSAENLSIDTTKPPFEVPCPVCLAYALGPCMTLARPSIHEPFPSNARVIDGFHVERRMHWERHPEFRVKATR